MLKKKLSYEEVKNNLKTVGYELISQEYINSNKKLIAKDIEGYYYYFRYNVLNYISQNNCISRKFDKTNPYTIQNINLWLKLNNKPFELISDKYVNNTSNLIWECSEENCSKKFEATWSSIHSDKVNCPCPYCSLIINCNLADINPELAKQWHPTKNGDLTPYDVAANSQIKVWWQCEQGHEWQAIIGSRNKGCKCPYCIGKFPSEEYNLLANNPELCEEWDYDKNNKKPEEYTPYSKQKVWWVCKKCGFKWKSQIKSRNKGIGCPQCSESKGEKRIYSFLSKGEIFNISQKEYDKLLGLGSRNLSYDFYLPDYNLLIEYQGIQHEKPVDFLGKGKKYAQEQFVKQQEHDRRKREYAQQNNIDLLEIWYYDFDNIEEILKKELLL